MNQTTSSAQRVVAPGARTDTLVVGGHMLVIPAGAVKSGPVTFTMTHNRNSRWLSVVVQSSAPGQEFNPRLKLSLSFASCNTSVPGGIDSIRVIREDDKLDRGGTPDRDRRNVSIEIGSLSTYTLATPN